MKIGKALTVTLKKEVPASLFREWDIIKSNNHPMFGKESWSIVTQVKGSDGEYTLSMRKLNVSKWKWVRNIQLKIVKQLFKDNP